MKKQRSKIFPFEKLSDKHVVIILRLFLRIVNFRKFLILIISDNWVVMGKKEAVVWKCSIKKLFLKTSQNSKGNTCARVSFLIKLQASGLQLY